MEKIHPDVTAAFDAGAEAVSVVITCEGDCGSLADRLGAAGATVDTGSAALGILSARIPKTALSMLSSAGAVNAVELDEDVSTL